MKSVGVAILGLGVVGSGTYKILRDHREFYRETQDVDISVESVLESNQQKALALGIEESKISEIVRLTGSVDSEIARSHAKELIKQFKN